MSEQEKLEALRAVLVFAKAGWASREGNMSFPPQFAVVQRVIDDQQRYLDDPVHLAVHCMGLFAEYLPFDMLGVLVLSDKHLSDDTIATLETDLEEADGWEFESTLFDGPSSRRRRSGEGQHPLALGLLSQSTAAAATSSLDSPGDRSVAPSGTPSSRGDRSHRPWGSMQPEHVAFDPNASAHAASPSSLRAGGSCFSNPSVENIAWTGPELPIASYLAPRSVRATK